MPQQVVIHQLYPVWSLLSRKTVFVYKYSQSDQDQLGCPEGDRSLLCGDGWMHLRPWCSQHLLSASIYTHCSDADNYMICH